MGNNEPVAQHINPGACLRPQGLEVRQYPTEHAGREWWITNERGERLARVRYCPWCGAAL